MRYLLIILVLLLGLSLSAQSLHSYEKAANEAFETKDYYNAMKYYKRAASINKKKTELAYKAGVSAYKFQAYHIAEDQLDTLLAIEDNRTAYPNGLYYLAQAELSQGKYNEAIMHFKAYDSLQPAGVFIDQAKLGVETSVWAIATLARGSVKEVTRLTDDINTGVSEYAPTLINDQLQFSSLRYEDIDDPSQPVRKYSRQYTYTEEDGTTFLSESYNSADQEHISNVTISPDGERLYFNRCSYEGMQATNCKIYVSTKGMDGLWSAGKLLEGEVNQEGVTNTQPREIGLEDGRTALLFASNRAGGKGGMDLYMATKGTDGIFGMIENLAVNSEQDEITPYYHQRTHTLYFSSNGYDGLGGFDVFKVNMEDLTPENIINLGAGINSSYNETYFFLKKGGEEGWFASNRPGSAYIDEVNSICCNDLYRAEFNFTIDLIVTTYNKLNEADLVGAQVQLINMDSGMVDTVALDPNSARYEFPIDPDQSYRLVGLKDGFSSDTVIFDTKGITESITIEQDLFLMPKIELYAYTFDAITKRKLNGVHIELIDVENNIIDKKYSASSNEYYWLIDFNKSYKILGSKTDYAGDDVAFDTKGITETTVITKELYLERFIESFLALPLYFDNDEPDKRNMNVIAAHSYEKYFNDYMQRRSQYIAEYAGTAVASDPKYMEVTNFFEDEVEEGYLRLQDFTATLVKILNRNDEVTIIMKGYASPRSPKAYNENLTKRRINSVENYFRSFDNGVLRSYYDQGRITVTEQPFGETMSSPGVSDSYSDVRNSIYNPKAARERRVEIIQIKVSPKS